MAQPERLSPRRQNGGHGASVGNSRHRWGIIAEDEVDYGAPHKGSRGDARIPPFGA